MSGEPHRWVYCGLRLGRVRQVRRAAGQWAGGDGAFVSSQTDARTLTPAGTRNGARAAGDHRVWRQGSGCAERMRSSMLWSAQLPCVRSLTGSVRTAATRRDRAFAQRVGMGIRHPSVASSAAGLRCSSSALAGVAVPLPELVGRCSISLHIRGYGIPYRTTGTHGRDDDSPYGNWGERT